MNKELDEVDASRKEFIEFADRVRADLSKCLDDPELTAEEKREIREQEMEILRMVDDKDREIRDQEIGVAPIADKKASENKSFNWK